MLRTALRFSAGGLVARGAILFLGVYKLLTFTKLTKQPHALAAKCKYCQHLEDPGAYLDGGLDGF